MNRIVIALCAVILAQALSGCNNTSKDQSTTAADTGSGGGNTPTPVATFTAPPEGGKHEADIPLKPINTTLNESGTATLTAMDMGRQTSVVINVKNEPSGEHQYAFLLYGNCDSLNGIALYPMSDLVNGTSNTTYNINFMRLAQMGPNPYGGGGGVGDGKETPTPSSFGEFFAVTVWRYGPSGKTLVSCGDLRYSS